MWMSCHWNSLAFIGIKCHFNEYWRQTRQTQIRKRLNFKVAHIVCTAMSGVPLLGLASEAPTGFVQLWLSTGLAMATNNHLHNSWMTNTLCLSLDFSGRDMKIWTYIWGQTPAPPVQCQCSWAVQRSGAGVVSVTSVWSLNDGLTWAPQVFLSVVFCSFQFLLLVCNY